MSIVSKIKFCLFFSLLGWMVSCTSKKQGELDARFLHEWNEAYESGIINDFFSPPVAGRMYTYPNLAAYAVLTNGQGSLLKALPSFPQIEKIEKHASLISLYVFYYVGKKTIYSFNYLDDYLKVFDQEMKQLGYSATELSEGKERAAEWAKKINEWSQKDQYKETRSDTKFVLSNKPGSWKPTAPDYADGLEPNWHKIRPFFLDSANQFTANYQPYPYNMTDKKSSFYKELVEVKEQVDKTNVEELATSKYWDCNPLAPQHVSHATYAEKKLTPGGHWMSITRNVSKDRKENITEAAKAYTLVSLAVNDGFIACWHSKYYYDYIRPITAIQDHWDSKWNTLILTPNFPEYPSGHSVISGVASTVLAAHYGNQTSFIDNAEELFGMPPRAFSSFSEACDQAAMSRFYAGIHFKKAIVDGVDMGREIGTFILKKLELDETKK